MFLIILINLKKNKILISCFLAYFSWNNQILENIFQFIFHCNINHQKIFSFNRIYLLKIHFSNKKKCKGAKIFVSSNLLDFSNVNAWTQLMWKLCKGSLGRKMIALLIICKRELFHWIEKNIIFKIKTSKYKNYYFLNREIRKSW